METFSTCSRPRNANSSRLFRRWTGQTTSCAFPTSSTSTSGTSCAGSQTAWRTTTTEKSWSKRSAAGGHSGCSGPPSVASDSNQTGTRSGMRPSPGSPSIASKRTVWRSSTTESGQGSGRARLGALHSWNGRDLRTPASGGCRTGTARPSPRRGARCTRRGNGHRPSPRNVVAPAAV